MYMYVSEYGIHCLKSTIPEWIVVIPSHLLGDGVLEYLSPVYFLLHTSTRDETVHDHVLLLANAERPIYRLCICCRVPARINCKKALNINEIRELSLIIHKI